LATIYIDTRQIGKQYRLGKDYHSFDPKALGGIEIAFEVEKK